MTIPNLITILRLILVPGVVLAMMQGRWDWAFAGFAVAGASDGVDGFIARRFDQRSRLGGYLDPMADKLLLVSVFVVLGVAGELPLWLVILVVSRDALIVLAVLLSSVMAQRPWPRALTSCASVASGATAPVTDAVARRRRSDCTSATASLTGPSPKICITSAPSNLMPDCISTAAAAISPSSSATGCG